MPIAKKILVVCPHPVNYAPGQRLKYEQYFDIWRSHGYELTIKPFMSEKMQQVVYGEAHYGTKIIETLRGYVHRIGLLWSLRQYDIVYCFLWVTPFGSTFFERLYCRFAKALVYDIDDLIYSKSNYSKWYIQLLKGYAKPIYLMKKARHVITCTPYLDRFVRQYNPNTTDISSTVDTETRYLPTNRYQNEQTLVIGWSGSHSTVRHLLTIENALNIICQKYPHVRIRAMGAAAIKTDNNLAIESIAWHNDIEISTLQSYDIGIYPLPNEEWVYGKSGLKAIQYMALGIPTVATAIGTIFRVIDNGISGFLVKTEAEWVQRLSQLIENPELRRQIGENARQKVVNEFSIKANSQKYLAVFESLNQ